METSIAAAVLLKDEKRKESANGTTYGKEPVQWALLNLQQPVYCPLGSLVIGSKLDAGTCNATKIEISVMKDITRVIIYISIAS